MKLNNESKTLFIPLLGKAKLSKDKIFLHDPKSEEIISKIDYDFSSLKQSIWLSMFLSLRALIIDELCNKYLLHNPNTTVIHLGCGLDSRCLRVNQNFKIWYDLDYKEVINLRKNFYNLTSKYQMISSSVNNYQWLEKITPSSNLLIVMEGLTMYLSKDELKELLQQLNNKFSNIHFIFDAYSRKGVKYSKIKNPVNQMNAQIKYGFDNYNEFLSLNEKLEYIATHLIKKEENTLPRFQKFIFNNLYCGKISQSLYKIYEFKFKE